MQKAFFECPKPIRLLTAGNGSGKSLALLMELIWTHTKTHPYRECSQVNHSWFITPGFDKVEDYCNELKRWCPPTQLPEFDRMGSSSVRRLRWPGGDTTTFHSIDSDFSRFEGTNFHKLFIDEPCPRAIYIAAMRGLRNSADWSVVWAMTPISEPWIYEDIYLPAVNGTNQDIAAFTGSSYDNPHLSRSFLKSFEDQLSDEEKRVRLHGEFAILQGRVFKEFERRTHVIALQDWPEDWPVYESLDVHTRKPNTAIWAGVTKNDELVILDECSVEGIPEFAEEIKKRRGKKMIVSTICDNSALSQDWSTRTGIKMLRDGGVNASAVRPQDKDVANGINKMKRMLKAKRLFVMENCRTLITEFEMYVWDDHRMPEKSGIKEKPRKIYDDFLDPLRYIINRDPRFQFNHEPINYRSPGGYNKDYTPKNPGSGQLD